MRIDLHTHSSVSDGTDTPSALVLAALAAGLDSIALTDHDTFDGVPEAKEAGRRAGLTVIAGVEMSAQLDGVSVHLLGYGMDRRNRPLLAELALLREGRVGRVKAMADRLTELGMPLTEAEIVAAAKASPSIGRPHVADAMVAKGYVADRDEAFRDWLADDKPGYVHRYSCELGRAIDLLHAAGGVAVIAHPWSRSTRSVLTAEVISDLVRDHQLDGIEVDHQDHDADTRSLLSDLAVRLGLVRTGSSDHHGTGKVGFPLGANLTRETALGQLRRLSAARGGQVEQV
ncbi:PHP domain-containing protein [Aestuariimicrobium sp. T2.26MG-19.2B]|uniref:PHP domain-containing protein n=1 Tax=Aestuariimicrobium sp. T2.26MG-19.2B TaxID=3040679 RepID=UPI002477B969|nr:PHP domain-containing protein [Aestuariimicrobium sp. T2.26MG-19.2B]CAI9410817.1 5'-3' exoribonuclease [Aestuariimicrobium sp. T2.26MG-19.2B]